LTVIETFLESPLLLLFTVIALGYGLGEVRIRKFKLGVAAVLFVGLAFGALDPGLSVPQFIIFLGLAMFVYTVGLSSAPAFFASFRRHGSAICTLPPLPSCCRPGWPTLWGGGFPWVRP
jgi:putative transport protein